MDEKPNIHLGLNREQVKSRIEQKMVNYDTTVPTKSYKQIIYENIFTLFNILNLVLGILIIWTGRIKNATFLGVAFCNTIISMVQEIRSKRAIDKLSVISSTKVNVIRDGKDYFIDVNKIVIDDIVRYKLGNQVVVDSLIREGSVEVDESFITGESDYVLKEKNDKLLSGSFIVGGSCIGQVSSVGDSNYTNKISKEAKYIKKMKSEIMITLNKIIKAISIVIIPLGIVLFLKQLGISHASINDVITSTVAALIGTIPEGLVLLTSTVFAVSSLRLAKRKILVQDLFCIENLARVDTFCLDKTGTLTTGNMHIKNIVKLDNTKDIDLIMRNISYNMEVENGTSKAICEYFEPQSNYKLANKVAFSSQKKCSIYEFEKKYICYWRSRICSL